MKMTVAEFKRQRKLIDEEFDAQTKAIEVFHKQELAELDAWIAAAPARRAAATARQREARAAERKFSKCRVCREPLKRVGQKYCSDACRQKAWRERNT